MVNTELEQQQDDYIISNKNRLKRPADHDHDANSPTTTGNGEEDDDQVYNNESANGNKMDNGDHQDMKQKNKDPTSSSIKQGGDLESTKAEMGEVMEENQRLKQHLDQIMKEYQTLQMKYYQVSQQKDSSKKSKNISNAISPPPQAMSDDRDEAEFVSLSLGRTSSLDSKKIVSNKLISIYTKSSSNKDKDEGASRSKNSNMEEANERSLDLGLDCRKFESSRMTSLDHQQRPLIPTSSPENSFEETREGEGGGKETWTPSTMTKNSNTTRSSGSGDDHEVVQQPPVKKARVSVRARCDTPTMNDGCQWRKYGQKIAKGNPCPRAYYRCTVAPSCPVRKQVQRCAEDMSILITTYEGAHNHPLPMSATAMASTTSAAACMLMSGSSTSSNQGSQDHTTTTTTIPPTIGSSADLQGGLNFNILNNSNPKPPFYFPTSSTATSYSPPTHPTITLDLTSTSTSSSTTQFNRQNSAPSTFAPKYSSTNLTFNSLDSSNNNTFSSTPWPNNNGLVNYGTQPYNKTLVSSTHQDHNNLFNLHTLLPKSNLSNNHSSTQQPGLPDTIAQAAKVLTSDPNFQSVLTAALSSFISSNNSGSVSGIVGNGSVNNGGERNNNINQGNDFAQKMIKWGSGGVQTSSSTINSTLQSTSKGNANGCGSSLLSMAPSTTNSQPAGSLMFLSPPSPFSTSKSASASPSDNRDHAS